MFAIPPGLLAQTVTVSSETGTTGDGTVAYSSGVFVSCRLQPARARRATRDGEVRPGDATLYASVSAPVSVGDRVVDADGNVYRVARVDRHRGPTGPSHLRASLEGER